jgi:hypothetical protein
MIQFDTLEFSWLLILSLVDIVLKVKYVLSPKRADDQIR